MIVALLTAFVTWGVTRRLPRVPWALFGIVFGSAIYWLVTPLVPGPPGALLGAPAPGVALPFMDLVDVPSAPRPRAAPSDDGSRHRRHRVSREPAVRSRDGRAMDDAPPPQSPPARSRRRQSRRRASSAACRSPTSSAVQMSMHRAGGRGALAALVCALALVAAMSVAPRVLSLVPIAATVGVMLVVSLGMFDQWSSTVWRRARVRDARPRRVVVACDRGRRLRDHRRVRIRPRHSRRHCDVDRAVRRHAEPLARAHRRHGGDA